ncbi:MAG: divergent polysaccharide deacetylase family protein [Acidaminococcaceae bacterium]
MVVRRKRKNSKGSGFLLLIIILALAVAGGFMFASSQDKNKNKQANKDTVVAINLDLRKEAKEAQRTIDGILLVQKDWQLSDDGNNNQKEKRADKKGDILWNQRQLLIGLPYGEDLEAAASWLTGKVKAENLSVVARKDITRDGAKAITMDIAIHGSVDLQKVTCTVDSLVFYNCAKDANKKSAKKPNKQLSGTMSIIVDDCGYDLEPVRTLTALPLNMTFAVIPFKANSEAALDIILANNKKAILHLPMEPMDMSAASESRMVTVAMTKEQVQNYTSEAINSLPGIIGVNNHQGSRATSNTATMKAVLGVLQSRDLFFVDSNTIAQSVGNIVAEQLGVPTARNQMFLDNSSDVGEIKKRIWLAAESANKNGSVIAICHARPNTAEAWSQIYPELKASGINLVPVTSLLY